MTKETMVPISALQAALKMRAVAYAHMFDVMCESIGLEKAMEIGQEATRRLGADMGPAYSEYAPDDLQGLKEVFLSGIPGVGELFIPEAGKCDDDELEIYFQKCPLKDARTGIGRSDEAERTSANLPAQSMGDCSRRQDLPLLARLGNRDNRAAAACVSCRDNRRRQNHDRTSRYGIRLSYCS